MSVDFIDNSQEVLAAFDRQTKRGLMAIGETAVGYAKNDTPVDTGRLRNSEDYKVEEDGVYIGTNVEYAPYIELGHSQEVGRYVPAIGKRLVNSHVAGKHFLKNAAANHSDEYKNIMETSLKS